MLAGFDHSLLFALNGLAGRSAGLDALIAFIGVYFWYSIPLGLLICWFVGRDRFRSRKLVLMTFIGLIISRGILAEILKLVIIRPRPFLVYPAVTQLIFKEYESAFPSGHAAAVFGMATVIYFYNRKAGVGLMVLGLLIGAARVAGGVHYPTDIIGGAVVGILAGLIVHYVIAPRGHSFTDRVSRISDRLLPFTRRG